MPHTTQLTRPSQSYIYAIGLGGSFLLQLIWPALIRLTHLIECLCIIGILITGATELYALSRPSHR